MHDEVLHPTDALDTNASLSNSIFKLLSIFGASNFYLSQLLSGLKPAIAGSDAHFPNEIGLAGVIANEDLKNSVLKNKIKWFGKRSTILNHLGTKLLKFKRGVK